MVTGPAKLVLQCAMGHDIEKGMRLSHRLIVNLGAAFLALGMGAGCTSQSERAACGARDWYELGRRDGSQGLGPERWQEYARQCPAGLGGDSETVYRNGRNAGLVEYCQPENAYELGKMGLAYGYVCPSTMEPQFLTAYRKGQQTRTLQLRKRELDTRIQSVSERILRAGNGTDEWRRLTDELNELNRIRAANESELSQLSVTK